jgi:hypothetical protein
MTLVAVLLLPVAYFGSRVSRLDGAFFLLLYVVYLAYLLLVVPHVDFGSQPDPLVAVVVGVGAAAVVGAVAAYDRWSRRGTRQERSS